MISNATQYLNKVFHQVLGRNYDEILGSITLLITIAIIYTIAFYWIKSRSWTTDKKRMISVNTRNTLMLIFLIGLIFLWSGEIKTMILSITALSVAIAVLFKDIILCFVGSIIITSNKLFNLGDYIEIDGIKGKVIDKNLMYTKLILYEYFQTREMNIPNITFITNKMINLSHYGKFQSYTLKLTVPSINNINELAKEAEKLIDSILIQYKEKYNEYFSYKKTNDMFFEVPQNYYSLEYDLSDNGNILIKLHYLAHPLYHREIENKISIGYIKKLENILKNETKELENGN